MSLLKVDVERAELIVLEGVKDADWPKIDQVAVEVRAHQLQRFCGRAVFVCAVLLRSCGGCCGTLGSPPPSPPPQPLPQQLPAAAAQAAQNER